jgi:hypothetical protein
VSLLLTLPSLRTFPLVVIFPLVYPSKAICSEWPSHMMAEQPKSPHVLIIGAGAQFPWQLVALHRLWIAEF